MPGTPYGYNVRFSFSSLKTSASGYVKVVRRRADALGYFYEVC